MTHRTLSVAAVTALVLLLPIPGASARQFEPPRGAAAAAAEESDQPEVTPSAPTIESIVEANRAGKPAGEIVAWITGSGTRFPLSLREGLALYRGGLPPQVLAAMIGESPDRTGALLALFPKSAPASLAEPGELTRRRVQRMVRDGAPEAEILREIAEKGAKASLTLGDAIDLHVEGAGAPVLFAIAGEGAPRVTAPPAGAKAAPLAPAAPAADAAAPTLDEALETKGAAGAGAPVPTLDEALSGGEDEGEEPEAEPEEETKEAGSPTLDEALGEEEEEGAAETPETIDTFFFVLSDAGDSRLSLAPASTRLVDLLDQAKNAGRTPARISLAPGAWYLLVEKKVDAYEAGIIPAMRTVLDGDGRTRTLIVSGDIYYDAERCCAPKSLSGPLSISRIPEDQQAALLGDEFDGLPPYLWDGNRYLILSIRDGRIRRALKVYSIRKATGESRTLTATFLPTASADTLAAPAAAAEEPGEVETSARESWTPPTRDEIAPIARFYDVPVADAAKLAARLGATGKAVVRRDGDDGSVRVVAFSLDSNSRVRAEEYFYRKDGPFGALSTPVPPPPPKKKKKAKPPAPPAPLAAVQRVSDPETFLPVLTVANKSKAIALVKLWDGTALFVAGGTSKDLTVSPGSGEIEARFGDNPAERRKVQAHFTYHGRYTLKLD